MKLEPIPEYGDLMTLEEFREGVRSGMLTDYDGEGQYATATQMSDVCVSPSDVASGLVDKGFTHVVWFNK